MQLRQAASAAQQKPETPAKGNLLPSLTSPVLTTLPTKGSTQGKRPGKTHAYHYLHPKNCLPSASCICLSDGEFGVEIKVWSEVSSINSTAGI